ncbi:MAG: flagellar protein FlaG [Burkholderiaceae bacterium]
MADQVTSALSAAIPGGMARSSSSALKQAASNPASSTVKAEVAKPEIQVVQIDPVEMQKKLQDIVDRLNEQASKNGRSLGFSVDQRLNRNIVIVTSSTTGEVVRQIPEEVVIRVGNRIEDLKGILFDERF